MATKNTRSTKNSRSNPGARRLGSHRLLNGSKHRNPRISLCALRVLRVSTEFFKFNGGREKLNSTTPPISLFANRTLSVSLLTVRPLFRAPPFVLSQLARRERAESDN